MQLIPITPVANQSLSFAQDGNRWDVVLKMGASCMVADISINGGLLLSGSRIMGDDFIIPYHYMGVAQGNLMLSVTNEEIPNWREFGGTQQLFYWTPEEMAGLANG